MAHKLDGVAKLRVAGSPLGLQTEFPEIVGHSVVVSDRVVRELLLSTGKVISDDVLLHARRGHELVCHPVDVFDQAFELDVRGIAKLGATVRNGDILVNRVRKVRNQQRFDNMDQPGAQSEFHYVDESLRYLLDDPGVVVRIEVMG
jgi:DNA-directed RNA polymerase beta subunit